MSDYAPISSEGRNSSTCSLVVIAPTRRSVNGHLYLVHEPPSFPTAAMAARRELRSQFGAGD